MQPGPRKKPGPKKRKGLSMDVLNADTVTTKTKERPMSNDTTDTVSQSSSSTTAWQSLPPKGALIDALPANEPVVPQQQVQDKTVTHVLTDIESNLLTHAYTGEVDWAGVVEAMDDYELMRDAFEVPPECMVRQEKKEFRYRWLDPTARERFDMQTSGLLRWWVCNRTNAPYISDQYRDANGLVRRSGLVLAKMPYGMYIKRQTTVWKLATPAQKVGPANGEGYEFTGEQGGRFKKGDIIHAEEKVARRIDPQAGTVREDSQIQFYREGKRYTGEAPDVVSADVLEA